MVNSDPRRGIGHEKVLTRLEFDHQAERLLEQKGVTADTVLPPARRSSCARPATCRPAAPRSTSPTWSTPTTARWPSARPRRSASTSRHRLHHRRHQPLVPRGRRRHLRGQRRARLPHARRPHRGQAARRRRPGDGHAVPARHAGRASRSPRSPAPTARPPRPHARPHPQDGRAQPSAWHHRRRLHRRRAHRGRRHDRPQGRADGAARPEVDLAVLETARGGLLRAGMGYRTCDVGAVLNVTSDHLGLRRHRHLEQLAEVKRIVVEVARDCAVLNADDERCLKMADSHRGHAHRYVTMNPRHELVRQHIRAGGLAMVLEEGINGHMITLYDRGTHMPLLWTHLIPATLEGKALHNVQNAMFAAAMAYAHGRQGREHPPGPAHLRHHLLPGPGPPQRLRRAAVQGHPRLRPQPRRRASDGRPGAAPRRARAAASAWSRPPATGATRTSARSPARRRGVRSHHLAAATTIRAAAIATRCRR
jgi:cyanophycin synthetase